ncbi:MAG: hypothetical protein PHO00_02195 [bacterium]|nr:hypothetical protein [bacterium]
MCDREKLIDLAWGEVTGEEAEKLLSHVNSCAGCKAEYEEMLTAKKFFLERKTTDVPGLYFENLPGRIIRRIKDSEKSAAGNTVLLKIERIAVLAAAACVFIIAGYYFVHDGGRPERGISADKPETAGKILHEEKTADERFKFFDIGKSQISSGVYTRQESAKLMMADMESKPMLGKSGLRKSSDKTAAFINLPNLGVRIQEVEGYGSEAGVLMVEDIDETSQAYVEGLRRGDRIIKLQGSKVNNIGEIKIIYDRVADDVYEIETDKGIYIIKN